MLDNLTSTGQEIVPAKPDWQAIRARFVAGESAREISAAIGGKPTRAAIQMRALREGWRAIKAEAQVIRHIDTELSRDEPDMRAIILSALRNGSPLKLAAAEAGVAVRTLHSWRAEDPAFAAQCRAARAYYLRNMIGHIGKAAKKDWRAAAYLIERARETRHDFRPNVILSPNGPQATQINISLPAMDMKDVRIIGSDQKA